ncbi:hypothetical protein ACFF45_34780, partial [Streptomyces cinereospinus]
MTGERRRSRAWGEHEEPEESRVPGGAEPAAAEHPEHWADAVAETARARPADVARRALRAARGRESREEDPGAADAPAASGAPGAQEGQHLPGGRDPKAA